MTAGDLAIVVATVLCAIGFAALIVVLLRVLDTLKHLREEVQSLKAETQPLLAELRTSERASQIASAERLLFGAVARWTTACARFSCASGSPTCSTAWAAETATTSACGSAMPTSSLARMTSRRAMKRASSPASSMRASQ